MSRRRPNFLICGAAQSGSSFLFEALSQHPQVYLPARSVPEPHFFYKSDYYACGIEQYLDDWFSEVSNEIAVGEKSSSYMFGGAVVAERIRRHLPHAKLIFLLRNPVERAFAHYRFSRLNGLELLGFREALERELAHDRAPPEGMQEINPYSYIARGLYFEQLKAFAAVFPSEQIHVLRSEGLWAGPEALELICGFLSVDPAFAFRPVPRFQSWSVRDPSRQASMRAVFGSRFGEVLRQLRAGEDGQVPGLGLEQVAALAPLRENLDFTREAMPEDCRHLLKKHFQEDIRRVQAFFDLDLSGWNLG